MIRKLSLKTIHLLLSSLIVVFVLKEHIKSIPFQENVFLSVQSVVTQSNVINAKCYFAVLKPY